MEKILDIVSQNIQKISRHQKQRTGDDTVTNKGTLRRPQQTPK
jgi:hypothetical protein